MKIRMHIKKENMFPPYVNYPKFQSFGGILEPWLGCISIDTHPRLNRYGWWMIQVGSVLGGQSTSGNWSQILMHFGLSRAEKKRLSTT